MAKFPNYLVVEQHTRNTKEHEVDFTAGSLENAQKQAEHYRGKMLNPVAIYVLLPGTEVN